MKICQNNFKYTKKNHTLSIPCCWSHPLDAQDENIERAVIVVHGVLRNADEYFPHMMEAVRVAGVESNTLVIAPQFLLEEDVAEFELADDVIFWGGETGEGWKKGDDSLSTEDHPRPVAVSSFEVVDRMVEQVALKGTFPNLKHVIVIGHSAGGQYVNRYAAGTRVGDSLSEGIQLRFIVANPSTYVYFNEERRLPETTNEFAVPENADPDYNNYKYGLDNLNAYMAAVDVETIRARYPKKDVVYLLGGEDIKEAHLEQTANAMLQGQHRLERGQVYYHYLKHAFGEGITQTQKIAIIPCVGHDHAEIFRSEAGVKYLFG
jgi:hypothetical protein